MWEENFGNLDQDVEKSKKKKRKKSELNDNVDEKGQDSLLDKSDVDEQSQDSLLERKKKRIKR